MTDQARIEIVALVRDVFEVDEQVLADVESLTVLEQWDSLRQLNLLLALEEHFGVELSPDDLGELTTIDGAVELVNRRRR
jgi:acyl carrier protein